MRDEVGENIANNIVNVLLFWALILGPIDLLLFLVMREFTWVLVGGAILILGMLTWIGGMIFHYFSSKLFHRKFISKRIVLSLANFPVCLICCLVFFRECEKIAVTAENESNETMHSFYLEADSTKVPVVLEVPPKQKKRVTLSRPEKEDLVVGYSLGNREVRKEFYVGSMTYKIEIHAE